MTRLPKEELKLQGPGRPAPPAHHAGPDAAPSGDKAACSMLLAVTPVRPAPGHPRYACPPFWSPRLHRPRSSPARAPADLGLSTAPPGSPPLTPAPSEAGAADGAEDQDCRERSYTRKSRPSGNPVSRPLSCFTVFQTRTLGWDWGFFLPTSQMAGWKERNWRREAELPFGGSCDTEVWAWTQGTGQECP